MLIVSSFAAVFPATLPILSLISEAAAVVKVIARMFDGPIPYNNKQREREEENSEVDT